MPSYRRSRLDREKEKEKEKEEKEKEEDDSSLSAAARARRARRLREKRRGGVGSLLTRETSASPTLSQAIDPLFKKASGQLLRLGPLLPETSQGQKRHSNNDNDNNFFTNFDIKLFLKGLIDGLACIC